MTGPLNVSALEKLAADCEHEAELVQRHALTLVALDGVEKGHVYSQEQVEEWVEQKKAERRQKRSAEPTAPSPGDSPLP